LQKTYLGIEIGGTKLQIALGNGLGKILRKSKLRVDVTNGGPGIRAQIAAALPELIAGNTLSAIGVGFGGPVDWRTGRICRSHKIEGWSGFDLGDWLAQQAGVSTFVDNDANVAALGEATDGAGAGFNPVFYVTLGSGVGGGLVVGGKIYHGATPGEAEIGHLRLDRIGTTLESVCSGWAVDVKIRGLKSKNRTGLLSRMVGEEVGGEAKFLAPALEQNDAAAKEILGEVVENLSFGLSHVVNLFHPEIIILGGGLSEIGEPLRGGVERCLRAFIMEAFQPGPRVVLAALGEDAVPVGALRLAADRASQVAAG
jgi:glucokinase